MASTLPAVPSTDLRPTAARRFGYSLAVVGNAVGLWLVHQLLDWHWPAFLTADFREVLPLLSASLVAGLVANVVFHVRDRGVVRALGDGVTSALGIAVSVRLLQVFPVDFTGYDRDWSGLVRVLLVVGIVGSAIGLVAALARLLPGGHPGD